MKLLFHSLSSYCGDQVNNSPSWTSSQDSHQAQRALSSHTLGSLNHPPLLEA